MNSSLISGTNTDFYIDDNLPISLADIKASAKLSSADTTYDAQILNCIRAVIEYFEYSTKYYIIEQQREILLDYFPHQSIIDFQDGNVKSIVSVAYKPTDWTPTAELTVLELNTDYYFAKETEAGYGISPSAIRFINTFCTHDSPQAVSMKLQVGNSRTPTVENIPFSLKKALTDHTTRMFSQNGEDCEECETSLTPAIRNIYSRFKHRAYTNILQD